MPASRPGNLMDEMNEQPTNSSTKDLSGRTVIIILSAVGVILSAICFAVGAWPLAIGFLLLPVFFFIVAFFSNLLGWILVGIPLLLFSRLCSRILPERFKNFAANKQSHPIVLIFPFLGLFGILLIVFRDFFAVTAVLLTFGFIFGLPAFVKWLLDRRKSKKPIDPLNQLGKQ